MVFANADPEAGGGDAAEHEGEDGEEEKEEVHGVDSFMRLAMAMVSSKCSQPKR